MANLIEKIKSICDAFDSRYDSYDEVFRKIEAVMHEINHPDFSKIKDGDFFLYKGIEWTRLGKEYGGILCITAKPIYKAAFDPDGNNDWRTAQIRKKLNTEFLEKISSDGLARYAPDLTADNGDTFYKDNVPFDYVGLLSCDLYRKYRDFIPLHNEGMWTCTPLVCKARIPNAWLACTVRRVGSFGALGNSNAYNSHGVVPACIFKF